VPAIDNRPAVLGGEPASKNKLEIVRPIFPSIGSFVEEFGEALASGAVTNGGPHVRKFEQQLAEYLGVTGVITCNNGESALLLALAAAGVAGGEVIVPSYTFAGTPHAVYWAGANVVFADIDESLCIDRGDVEAKITASTKAVLAVDVYGIPCDYEALEKIGQDHGISILYDSAPAFGTRVNGETIGGAGLAQQFSFHATKPFATMEGGCIASNDEEFLRNVADLRNFGQSDGADCRLPGINAKMTEVTALIGLQQLVSIDDAIDNRIEIADMYIESLGRVPGLSFALVPNDVRPSWAMFPLIVDSDAFGMDRNQLATAMAHENINLRKYFEMPCHKMQAYRSHNEISLPNTERVASEVIALPIYNDMSIDEASRVIAGIERIHEYASEVLREIEVE
jgi:dTDP-4-amino-4,6-dideoxygalactose transaminase